MPDTGRQQPAVPSKLKVLVRLDVDRHVAHIQIRGNITARNLGAVYALARRANTVIDGLAVILDLRHAVVGEEPMEELHQACDQGRLPSAVGSPAVPCRLKVLEPAA